MLMRRNSLTILTLDEGFLLLIHSVTTSSDLDFTVKESCLGHKCHDLKSQPSEKGGWNRHGTGEITRDQVYTHISVKVRWSLHFYSSMSQGTILLGGSARFSDKTRL